MDPGQSEYYEFLDLTDIDDSERYQLNNTLFPSEQSSHDLSDSGVWNEGTFESDRLSTLNSGSSVPPSESDFSMNGDHQAISPQFGVASQCPPANANMYGASYNMQQPGTPSHMYHMMQPAPLSNVYVGNVTANVNVHGYMGHYIPFMTQPPIEQSTDVSLQRPPHSREYNPRGRRNRGGHNKRDYTHQPLRSQQIQQQQMQQEIDVPQQPTNTFQYVPVPYQSAYYHPSAPQNHMAQHATGSPIYLGQHLPMYTPMPHVYQFHPGMVFSPVGMPAEYQLVDPSGKLDNCDMEIYQQTSDITQHMIGLNIQGEELYNCVNDMVPNEEVNDFTNMNQNSIVLEECSQDGIDLGNNLEKPEVSVDVVPIENTNANENVTSISFENVPANLQKNDEMSIQISAHEGNSINQLRPIPSSENVDTNQSHVIFTESFDTNKTQPVSQPGNITDANASQLAILSVPKPKGPFVNNKDIVKTGLDKKSSSKQAICSQNKALQNNQMEMSAITPQHQEVQKLQADKLNDTRPKSQTPPNSVWVNNQLYTPPSDTNENVSDKLELKIDLSKNEKSSKSDGVHVDKQNFKTTQPALFDQKIDDGMTCAPSQSKSWASLFNNKTVNSSDSISSVSINSDSGSTVNSVKPVALVQPLENSSGNLFTNSLHVNKQKGQCKANLNSTNKFEDDPESYRAGEFLSKYSLDNKTISLQPRGLTNRSNYCYINSTLQALIACPPLYNLLKALPFQVKKGKSSTPVIDAMKQLVYEFSPLPPGARVGRREKGQQRKDELPDVSTGPAFEPLVIHRMLNGFHPNTFQVEGRQEDAEEFLSCLLNGLNDEMVELIKLNDPEEKSQESNPIVVNGHTHCGDDDDDWKVMGPKNKGSITRRSYFGRSPISDIFRGQLRSRVQRAGDLTTDSVQPFFTLQLDIEKAASVSQALELLVGRDQLEGVTCSKTNQEIEAWQQVSLEELPVVLILHLKWFDYKLDGCTKIVKTVEFPIDLKIDSKIMSSKIKYTAKQRQYKLFAVVYHDGKEASKGHYITDVFHVGFNGWIRYDDSVVKAVTENMVLHPRQPRVPYLLYYRRCDTIGPSSNASSRTH